MGKPGDLTKMDALLNSYSRALSPWATFTAGQMVNSVDKLDRASWNSLSGFISSGLRRELQSEPTGHWFRALLNDQVDLIQSLPRTAAKRVHHLTTQALLDGTRAREIADDIARSGEVTASHATLIARTEVSRTASVLVQARCESVGISHYHWRGVGDGDERPGHLAMEGTVCAWASAPGVLENGRIMYFHPGCIWNCRCWAEPVIDFKQLARA